MSKQFAQNNMPEKTWWAASCPFGPVADSRVYCLEEFSCLGRTRNSLKPGPLLRSAREGVLFTPLCLLLAPKS